MCSMLPLLLALLLQPIEPKAPPGPLRFEEIANPPAEVIAACAATGGRVVHTLGQNFCEHQMDDAGKSCSDASDCKGAFCRFGPPLLPDPPIPKGRVRGVCSTTDNQMEMSCRIGVEHGRAVASPCI